MNQTIAEGLESEFQVLLSHTFKEVPTLVATFRTTKMVRDVKKEVDLETSNLDLVVEQVPEGWRFRLTRDYLVFTDLYRFTGIISVKLKKVGKSIHITIKSPEAVNLITIQENNNG